MVIGHIGVELSLHHPLDQLWEGRNDGNRSEVGGICWVSGFVDRMHNGMFPGGGILTGCETGVQDVKNDVTDDIKGKLENFNTDTVGATSS